MQHCISISHAKYVAEANTILQSNYPQLKINSKKEWPNSKI